MIANYTIAVFSIFFMTSVSGKAEATAPPPFSEELTTLGETSNPTDGYTKDFGVSVVDAKVRRDLHEKATSYTQSLVETSPTDFVNFAIRHSPNFKITVYYGKDIDRTAQMRSVLLELRKYLNFNPINKSRTTLDQKQNSLSTTVACKNMSTVAASNRNCYFTYITLRSIRGYSPFSINITGGFVTT